MLEHELARFRSGLLFIHFLGIDQDSHLLWGKYDDELLTTYQRVDAEVGRVLETSGRRFTAGDFRPWVFPL